MSNNLRRLAAAGLMVAPALMATGCEAMPSPMFDAIDQAASTYNLSTQGLIGLTACESTLDPSAENAGHAGPLQQAKQYWPGRVARYNKLHPDAQVSTNIKDPLAGEMVSAEMMASGGPAAIRSNWTCESATHCYTAPDRNRACKPGFWKAKLAQTGRAIIANRIVVIAPVNIPHV